MAQPLWKMLVTGDADLDDGLLRLAWRRASEAEDREALALLAGRLDLPDEVDAAARTHKWAEVRGAWLGRSGQDREVLLAAVAGERANSALIVAASRTNDPDVLTALATRGGKGFDTALASVAALPSEVAADVFLRVTNHWPSGPGSITPRRLSTDVLANFKRRADIHDQVALRLTSSHWISAFDASPTISSKAIRHLCNLAVKEANDTGFLGYVEGAIAALCDCEQLDEKTAERMSSDLAQLNKGNMRWRHPQFQACLARKRTAETKRAKAAEALGAASLDPAELDKLAAVAQQRGDKTLARALFANPLLSPVGMALVATSIPYWELAQQAHELLDRDEKLLQAVISVVPEIISYMHHTPRSTRTRLAKELHRQVRDGEAKGTAKAWETIARWAEPTLDEVLDMPYETLAFAESAVRGETSLWVGKQLGHSPQAFEALDVLARNYEGSLRDLVVTSQLVVSD